MKEVKKYLILTLILIALSSLIRFVIADNTGLGIGESYYFKGAKLLQLSYFDQPPLFFWISGLSIRIFGYTTLALRLPAILFFTGTLWFLYRITSYFFGEKAGFFAVILLNICFVFTIPIACWFQPDAPLMFFWLACTWCILQLLFPKRILSKKKENILWVLIGISLGLTILSKYHAIFLPMGVFIFILLNKEYRKYLKQPGPYFALIISLLFTLPVIIWNSQHEWVSFIFQGSRAGSYELKIHPEWLARSILGQSLWLAPWIWIPLIIQLFKSYKAGKDMPVFSLLFWIAVLPIGFFTLVTLWSNMDFHFHWQAPGYMVLFIVLGKHTAERWNEHIRTRIWLYCSGIITVAIGSILIFHMNHGILDTVFDRMIENTEMSYDPTIDGIDYIEIYDRFEAEGWNEDDSLFIGATTWWQIGKTDWALKGKKDALVFTGDPRNYAYFVDPVSLLGFDAIVITRDSDKKITENIVPFFAKITQLENIDISRNGKVHLSLKVFYCDCFQIPVEAISRFPVYRQLTDR
ncbi:ArnT family glycosyltransferase [Bacteroidota bacterium]